MCHIHVVQITLQPSYHINQFVFNMFYQVSVPLLQHVYMLQKRINIISISFSLRDCNENHFEPDASKFK